MCRDGFADGFTAQAVQRAPVLVFNRKDLLQERFARQVLGVKVGPLAQHCVPSPNAFVEASLLDLGWGLNPEQLVLTHLRKNRLRELVQKRWFDVPLYWQRWTLGSPSLDALTAALHAEAKASLRRI